MILSQFQFLILAVAALGLAESAPAQGRNAVEVVNSEFSTWPDGGYSYSYELSDGSYKDEYAYLKQVGDQSILVVSGSYGYTGDDGKIYRVRYTSDENGFHASGDHLPDTGTDVAPPPIAAAVPPALEISPSLVATLVG